MTKIYKYKLDLQDTQIINAPIVKPLCAQKQSDELVLWAQKQGDELVLWAEVDTAKDNEIYQVTIVGTGHSVPTDAGEYLSTIQDRGCVWHVYIRGGMNEDVD